MRTRLVPDGARHLRTYAEFASYLVDFIARRYPFIWVVGRPGLGKSESIKAAMRQHRVLFRKGGQLTPAQFYIECHLYRGAPVILDDAEHILDNAIGAKLISALGDTSVTKLLCWSTTSRHLGDVPQSFETTSPLCIIANKGTVHEAIQSRALILHFDPNSLEVHQAVARWFWDQEIHDWFGKHLNRLAPIDIRWYVLADRDKRSGRDWRAILLATRALNRASCIVQDLESEAAAPTREDKARRFKELMGNVEGASRPTYFRLRHHLEEEGRLNPEGVAPMRLIHSRPPSEPTQAEVDAMGRAGQRPEPEPEQPARPVDVSARAEFQQPIRATGQQQVAPPRPILDDTLPGELPEVRYDDEEGEQP